MLGGRSLLSHSIIKHVYFAGVLLAFSLAASSQSAAQTGSEEIPLHRLARPEEVADVIVWLASDRASYVTGQTMSVNGGRYCNCASH